MGDPNGPPVIFPTSSATVSFPRTRVYVEQDVDGLTLFGYSEPDVQQALRAQLDKYEATRAEAAADDEAGGLLRTSTRPMSNSSSYPRRLYERGVIKNKQSTDVESPPHRPLPRVICTYED